jgi:hypothetical protein
MVVDPDAIQARSSSDSFGRDIPEQTPLYLRASCVFSIFRPTCDGDISQPLCMRTCTAAVRVLCSGSLPLTVSCRPDDTAATPPAYRFAPRYARPPCWMRSSPVLRAFRVEHLSPSVILQYGREALEMSRRQQERCFYLSKDSQCQGIGSKQCHCSTFIPTDP